MKSKNSFSLDERRRRRRTTNVYRSYMVDSLYLIVDIPGRLSKKKNKQKRRNEMRKKTPDWVLRLVVSCFGRPLIVFSVLLLPLPPPLLPLTAIYILYESYITRSVLCIYLRPTHSFDGTHTLYRRRRLYAPCTHEFGPRIRPLVLLLLLHR